MNITEVIGQIDNDIEAELKSISTFPKLGMEAGNLHPLEKHLLEYLFDTFDVTDAEVSNLMPQIIMARPNARWVTGIIPSSRQLIDVVKFSDMLSERGFELSTMPDENDPTREIFAVIPRSMRRSK